MKNVKSDINLYLLGKRNYVKSANQLEYALIRIKNEHKVKDLSEIFVRRFKQIEELCSPVEIILSTQQEPKNSLRATLAVNIAGKYFNYKLIAIPGSLKRYIKESYRQINYRENSDTEATVQMTEAIDFWEVLSESVQLAKVFHIKKYNDKLNYRFVVGGFDNLRYIKLKERESIEINCQILRQIIHENNIYNQLRIVVKSNSEMYSFLMPFIGRYRRDEY